MGKVPQNSAEERGAGGTGVDTRRGAMAQDLEAKVVHLLSEVDRLQRRLYRLAEDPMEGGAAPMLWRACPPLGCGMVRPHLVTLGNAVYVGGGNTRNLEMSRRVHKFAPGWDKWESLPITPYLTFALSTVNGHLTVIGGVNIISSLTSGDLIHFDADVKKWKRTLPPMPTKRCAASATTLGTHLVVAGGHHKDGKSYLGTVEVLDTEKLVWSRVHPLPKPTTFMSMASCGVTDRIYLLGGLTKQGSIRSVFSCVLDDLLASASEEGEVTERDGETGTVWEVLTETPYHRMGAIALGGKLVVASGLNEEDKTTRTVHAFSPVSRKWEVLGEMAAARSSCSLASLREDTLMVVGGYVDPRNWMASLTTDVIECVNLRIN